MSSARTTNKGMILYGASLHSGERQCVRCGQRIGENERCVADHRDASDQLERFRHVRCPSPYVPATSSLARAAADAQAVLARARQRYRETARLPEPTRSALRADLAGFGRTLRAAVDSDDRLVAAGLVLAFREWERLHADALHQKPPPPCPAAPSGR